MDAPIISLDIETYGAARHRRDWARLPAQKYFHPRKSSYWQQLSQEDLILTCAVTVADSDPRTNGDWCKDSISQLKPGETIILELDKSMHRECLAHWIRHADTIIGSNIQFDLLFLRAFDNMYKFMLDGRHTYIDTTIVAYLWNELSSSRSLKKLGPLLGQFTYDESLADGNRFNHVADERLLKYNAEDTHNTLLVLAELAKRLPPHTDKMSKFCIDHYSGAIHSVVCMTEEGIPFSSMQLEQLHDELEDKISVARIKAEECGLILSGKGSAQSKDEFFNDALTLIENSGVENVIDLLDKTPKTKKISHSKKNRTTLTQYLPSSPTGKSLVKDGLHWFGQFQEAQKLLSTYVFPLLLHKRNDPTNLKSSLIPWTGTHSSQIPFPSPDDQKEVSLFSKTTTESTLTLESSTPCSSPLPPPLQTSTPFEQSMPLSSEKSFIKQTLKNNQTSTPAQLKNRFTTERVADVADAAAYPSWFITPSRVKNDQGSEGGTIQGRITCKDPSAQTFPPHIKECMASRFPGGKIVGVDLSQIELRVAALISGEPSMREAYINGEDLHAQRARSLWSDYDQVPAETKRRRQVGKMMNFADLFLSSANTMKQQVYAQSGGDIDLPIEVFREVVKTRDEVRPVLTAWQKKMIWTAKARHRIELPLIGQSRYFSDISKERSEIVNFPVQTTASNLMMQIQTNLQNELNRKFKPHKFERPRLFLQVFDAVYLDTPAQMVGMIPEIFSHAVRKTCESGGYWNQLAQHYDCPLIPLEFDTEILDLRSPPELPHEQSIQARPCNQGAA